MSRWFLKDHFSPAAIRYDPAFFNAPQSYQKLYLLLCRRSYLVRHSPTRRYCEWTYRQLAEQVGLKERQVGTIMRYLMRNYLIYRWYAGDSGTTTPNGRPRPPRYEIPASRGMINWWRRVRRVLKVKFHHRKEVTVIKTAKKYHYRCPYCLTQSQRNGQDGWQGILGRKNRPPKCEVCGVRTRHIYRK